MTNDAVKTRCPGCQTLYQIAPDRRGKAVRCRRCGQSWTPADAETSVKPAPVARAATATATQPDAPPAATATAVAVPRKPARPAAAPPPPRSNRRLLLAVGAGVGAVVIAAAMYLAMRKGDAPKVVAKAELAKPVQESKPAPPPNKPSPPAAPAKSTPPAAPAPAAKPAPPPKPAVSARILETDEFFRTPKVLEISIDIAPGDYEALKREPRKYVRATLKEGEKTWANVAVHLKGAAGSFRNIDDKPGLTLNMDKFVDGQSFHGLDKFHLNNSVQDGSFVSELICSEIFRSLGVPTSRCAHAIVTLNGKPKGFFILKEGYDVQFLERNFGSKKGNLYDGGFLRELDQQLQVISEKDDLPPYTELKSLMNAAQLADPAKRFSEMERLLDADRWVTYLVLEVLMFDWDGYPMNRNNYRVYHDPKRDKIIFIPSGTDQMFGDPNGPLLPNFNGFIAKAYVTTPEGRQRYLNRMDEILKTGWKIDAWNKRLDELEAVLKPALAKVDPGAANGLQGQIGRLRAAFQQRLASAGPALKRLLNPVPPKTIAGGPGLPDDGFLRKYLFLGPINVAGTPGPQAINKDWLNGEAALKPKAGLKTGDLTWKAFEAPDGMVDFHAAAGRQADNSAAYLFAYLICEKDFKDLKLKMGSDDQGKVWINGKDVLKFEGDRGAAPDQDNADNIVLNKGVNTVLFKVVNGGGGFQGILRFTLPDGSPFMDARLSLDGK